MAQLAYTDIQIEGRSINNFSLLTLSQAMFGHHSFCLVCPAEAIDGTSNAVFHASKNLAGAPVTIQVNAAGSSDALQFAGLVSRVEAARYGGHNGDIIISGFSPTIIMDSGPHCKSWEKKFLKDIVHEVLQKFPQNILKSKLNVLSGETLSYVVQYKETAWQFLHRLCSTYGEWLFYDGTKLHIGSPQGKNTELVYGSNLSRFNMALQVKPAGFQMMAYDYLNAEVYSESPGSIADNAGLNDLGKYALQKSEKFYNVQPKEWNNQFVSNKKQLDDYVNTRAARQSSDMVRFQGTSDHPGLQVGGSVNVKGKNIFSEADEAFGEYTIASINHSWDGQGNYSNDFEAIPSSIKVPPVTPYAEPRSETQSALVTDNYDPGGLGRVRVKFHWMDDNEKTPWLRITSPHGGEGKGMFFIPEIGEEVIVGFEGDSPVKPYIVGTVYNEKAKTSFGNAGNDVKVLQTRSGNKVVMNDKEESIIIADPSGNTVTMDGNGKITIHAPKELTLTSKSININAENSIILNASSGGAKINMQSQLIDMHSGGAITATANTNMSLTGTENLSTTTQELNMSAAASANIDAGTLTLNGGSRAVITSADTDIF